MTQYLRTEYNMQDPEFISIIDDLPFWSAPFGIRLLDTVRYKKNISALDIGSGFGFPLLELAMRLGASAKVYGIDPDKTGIDRANLKIKLANITNVELVRGIAEEMPFENGIFDLIISNNGINNVRDLAKTLRECNRVSKKGSQFIFNYNTDKTFVEFYNIYREVLNENKLENYGKKIDSHIYEKRKPLAEFRKSLASAGFKINKIYKDEFKYRFSDGSSMLNHFFMKLAFLGPWKKVLPRDFQEKIFVSIENKINLVSEKRGGFSMKVPFITIDCEKVREIENN